MQGYRCWKLGDAVGEEFEAKDGGTRVPELLKGLTVVEVGKSVATSVAGAALAGLGASVTRVNLLGDLTRRVASGVGSGPRIGELLDAGKTVSDVDASSLSEWLESCLEKPMVVLLDTESTPARPELHDLEEYCAMVEGSGVPSWITVSPYGLTGPMSGTSGGEPVYLAAGGVLGYISDGEGRPILPAGWQGSFAVGHVAAIAALHGLSRWSEYGEAQHLEVSAQEAVLVTSTQLECAHVAFGLPGEGGSRRYGPPRGLLDCRDGQVYVTVLADHHWNGMRKAMGDPEWARGLDSLESARKGGETLNEHLRAWSSSRDKDEIVAQLQHYGVPATAVNTCRELLSDDDYVLRRFFTEARIGTENVTRASVPFLTSRKNSASHDSDQQLCWRSLNGCVIADFTHVLAGPLATSWLGAMGAEVYKFEDPDNLDLYRRLGPFPADERGHGTNRLEVSGYFSAVNFSKKSVAGSSDVSGTLRNMLIENSDVIIENLSESRRRRLGLDFASLWARNPDAVLVSSSGFGRYGSRSAFRAYGTNIHCHGGIVGETRDASGQVRNIETAWADPLTALWLVLIVASARLGATRAIGFDVSMAEVVSYQLMDRFAAQRGWLSPEADERPPATFLECSDGWILVVAKSREERARFDVWREQKASARVAGSVTDPNDPPSQPVLIGTVKQAVRELRCENLDATAIETAASLIDNEHLASRGFFQHVPHSLWGYEPLLSLPWRPARSTKPFPLSPTPLIGENTKTAQAELFGRER